MYTLTQSKSNYYTERQCGIRSLPNSLALTIGLPVWELNFRRAGYQTPDLLISCPPPYQLGHRLPLKSQSCVPANLKSHIKINHDPEKLRRCPDCDFKTSSRKAATEHSRTHAAEPKNHQCPECSYQCMALTAMKTHMMVRSYQCITFTAM